MISMNDMRGRMKSTIPHSILLSRNSQPHNSSALRPRQEKNEINKSVLCSNSILEIQITPMSRAGEEAGLD